MGVVRIGSAAAIAAVEGGDQQDGPVAGETHDVVIAVDAEAAVDASCCWMEGGAGCWIVEVAY
jgi:hypothetical protein